MFRIALSVVLCLTAGSCLFAQSSPTPPANDYSIIVVTADQPSAAGARLLDWFQSDAKLAIIRGRVAYHAYTPSNDLYRERYIRSLPPSPLPVVAMADGGAVFFKLTGDAIPNTPDALFALMAAEFDAYRKAKGPTAQSAADCPTCPNQPQPQPPAQPPAQGPLSDRVWDRIIPDTVTVAPTVDLGNGAGIAIAIGGVVLLLSVGGFCLFLLVAAVGTFIFLRS